MPADQLANVTRVLLSALALSAALGVPGWVPCAGLALWWLPDWVRKWLDLRGRG